MFSVRSGAIGKNNESLKLLGLLSSKTSSCGLGSIRAISVLPQNNTTFDKLKTTKLFSLHALGQISPQRANPAERFRQISSSSFCSNHDDSLQNKADPKTLQAFKELVDNLSEALKMSKPTASYSETIAKDSILLSNNDNPSLSAKQDDEGKRLILKRRPWKYRYPKPQKYYEPGGLTGIEWKVYEDEFTQTSEDPLELLSIENKDASKIGEEPVYSPNLNPESMDFLKFKESLSQPTNLLDSIVSEFKKSRKSNNTSHPNMWKDEDLEFAKDINKLIDESDSFYKNTKSKISITNKLMDTASFPASDPENNKKTFNSKPDWSSGSQYPKNRIFKKGNFNTVLDKGSPANKRSYSTSNVRKTGFKPAGKPSDTFKEQIKPIKHFPRYNSKNKLFFNKNKGLSVKLNTPSPDSLISTEFLSSHTKIITLGSTKVVVYDDEFPLATHSTRPQPEIGDIVEVRLKNNSLLLTDISMYTTLATIVSANIGRFKLSGLIFDEYDFFLHPVNLNIILPYYFFRKKALSLAGVIPSDLALIRKYLKGNYNELVPTDEGLNVPLAEYIQLIIRKHALHVSSELYSDVIKALSFSDLDPEMIWKNATKNGKKSTTIEEIALQVIFANSRTKRFFIPESPRHYGETVSKDIFNIERAMANDLDNIIKIDIVSWDIARLAANELLGSNPHLFFPENIDSPYNAVFNFLSQPEVNEIKYIKKLIKEDAPAVKSFRNKAISLIANKYRSNAPSVLYELFPAKEIEFRKQIEEKAKSISQPIHRSTRNFFSKDDLKIISMLKKYVIYSNNGYHLYFNCYFNIIIPLLKPLKLYDFINQNVVYNFLVDIGAWTQYTNVKMFDREINLPQVGLSPQIEADYKKCLELAVNSDPYPNKSNLPNVQRKPRTHSTRSDNLNLPEDEFYGQDLCESIRHDFGDLQVYTIDSESTTDIDDGISIEKIKNDSDGYDTWLHIHIADPTRLLHPNHKISRYAESRISSIYFPGATIHMLPMPWGIEQFSLYNKDEDITSIQKPKYAMTSSVRIGSDGDILEYKIRPSIIKNIKCLSYEAVDQILPFNNASISKERYNELSNAVVNSPSNESIMYPGSINSSKVPSYSNRSSEITRSDIDILLEIHKVASRHLSWRVKSGMVSYSVSRPIIGVSKLYSSDEEYRFSNINNSFEANLDSKCDDLEYPEISTEVDLTSESPSHLMVSELMIISGRAAARFATQYNVPVAFRVQNRPRLEEAASFVFDCKSALPEYASYTVDELNKSVTPRDIWNAALKHVNPVTGMLNIRYYDEIRYFMSPAEIKTKPGDHSSLGIFDKFGYTRFTSPMRRYPDLLVHWQIKHQILVNHGLARPEDIPFSAEKLESMFHRIATKQVFLRDLTKSVVSFWATKLLQRIEYVARRATDPDDPLSIAKYTPMAVLGSPSSTSNTSQASKHSYIASPNILKNVRFVSIGEAERITNPNNAKQNDKIVPIFKASAVVEKSTFNEPTEVYENRCGMVPVWKAVVANREATRDFIIVTIKGLGIEAKMLPAPADAELVPFAGEEIDVIIKEIDITSNLVVVRRVFE